MNIVIPCASKKNLDPLTRFNQQNIHFQAMEEFAEGNFTPWSKMSSGDGMRSFVELLKEVNLEGFAPGCLLPAWKLYDDPIYKLTYEWCEEKGYQLYILSAGWGLVEAKTLLPCYNITFSNGNKVDEYAHISVADRCKHESLFQFKFNDDVTHLFLPKSYLDFYLRLCDLGRLGGYFVHWRSQQDTTILDKYEIPAENREYHDLTIRTNWHYQALKNTVSS